MNPRSAIIGKRTPYRTGGDMRSLGRILAAAILMVTALSTPSWGQLDDPPLDTIVSDNVTLLTTVPDPGVIGARFRDGLMFVTSVSGLTVYDVSEPSAPALIGALPLPHFENEDVDLGGDILLISNDAAESTGILYVIDISDPTSPQLLTPFPMGGSPAGGPGHTASCIKRCKFAWVTDAAGIKVIDLRDPAAPVDMGKFETAAGGDIAVHDVQVDGNGLAWVVGFGGADAYKVPRGYDGTGLGKLVAQTDERGLSTYLTELGIGDGSNPNDYILHNSYRKKDSRVVMITEEDYNRPGCKGAGSFETWRVPTYRKGPKKGLPNGKQVTLLDHWETEFNVGGEVALAAMCSAHYFDVRGKVVAQGWYEQGTRFLDVSNPKNIRQIGFFAPPSAMTWAAYFPPTDPSGSIVYSFDASHGIDVLQLSLPGGPSKAATVEAPVRLEWSTAPTVGTPNGPFGFACRLGLSDSVDGVLPLPPLL
jgi:hypothetical protein